MFSLQKTVDVVNFQVNSSGFLSEGLSYNGEFSSPVWLLVSIVGDLTALFSVGILPGSPYAHISLPCFLFQQRNEHDYDCNSS